MQRHPPLPLTSSTTVTYTSYHRHSHYPPPSIHHRSPPHISAITTRCNIYHRYRLMRTATPQLSHDTIASTTLHDIHETRYIHFHNIPLLASQLENTKRNFKQHPPQPDATPVTYHYDIHTIQYNSHHHPIQHSPPILIQSTTTRQAPIHYRARLQTGNTERRDGARMEFPERLDAISN